MAGNAPPHDIHYFLQKGLVHVLQFLASMNSDDNESEEDEESYSDDDERAEDEEHYSSGDDISAGSSDQEEDDDDDFEAEKEEDLEEEEGDDLDAKIASGHICNVTHLRTLPAKPCMDDSCSPIAFCRQQL